MERIKFMTNKYMLIRGSRLFDTSGTDDRNSNISFLLKLRSH